MTKQRPEQSLLALACPPQARDRSDHHLDFPTASSAHMERSAPPAPPYPGPEDGAAGQEPAAAAAAAASWSQEPDKSSKKKNYQRYPKPPYSYLAMIAMVIQRSPEKKLTLSEVRAPLCPLSPVLCSVLCPRLCGSDGSRILRTTLPST